MLSERTYLELVSWRNYPPKIFLTLLCNYTTQKQTLCFHQLLGKLFQKQRPQSLQEKPGHPRTFYHSLSLGTGLSSFLMPCPLVTSTSQKLPCSCPRAKPPRMRGLHISSPVRKQEDLSALYLCHIYPHLGGGGGQKE